jgi:pyruvate/2-oxoglutarate dehydrogenase complex dihydrolipoamide dehydrogenase (E3) component
MITEHLLLFGFLEFGQVFVCFEVKWIIIERGDRLISKEDDNVDAVAIRHERASGNLN